MYIRSQDGMHLVNTDNVFAIDTNMKERSDDIYIEIAAHCDDLVSDFSYVLGTYRTHDEARYVLDLISKEIKKGNLCTPLFEMPQMKD